MKNKEKLLNNNNDNLIYKNNNNIRFKRMNRRLKGGWLVFALSTLSMVSVGFSTWVVTGPASGYGQIGVVTDDVINNDKYFMFNQSETSTNQPTLAFKYNDYGVVNDGVIGTKGSFSFWMAVMLRGDDALFSTSDTISSFSFDYLISDRGSFKLLNYLASASYEISNGSNKVESNESNTTIDKNNSPYSITTTCSDGTLLGKSKLFYKVTLNFSFENVSDFKTEIADNMKNASLDFSIRYGG